MEFGGRYKSGKIMTKRLARIKTLQDRRPFGRRIIKSNQSYAFAIASDISGSMGRGAKETNLDWSLSSLYMTGEALKIANTARALIIFGENAVIINPLDKNKVSWEKIIAEDTMKKADPFATSIGKAMNTCTEELDKSRAERKIMIILTDGYADTEEILEEYKLAAKRNIECLAIIIGNGTRLGIESVFPENNITRIERNKKEIGEAFMKILKSTITRSK